MIAGLAILALTQMTAPGLETLNSPGASSVRNAE